MANELTVVEQTDLTKDLASLYRVTPGELIKTLKTMCFPAGAASDAQLIMFLTVCRERKLNPLMKEVYPLISKDGKMTVNVEVDGWIRKAQEHAQFEGFEAIDEYKDNKIFAVTCKIFRKDWAKRHGEYRALLSEWYVPSNGVWVAKPRHMLFIKAFNEAVRFTLGLTGISDDTDAAFMAADGAVTADRAASAPAVVAEEPEEAVVVNEETGEVVGATPPAEVMQPTDEVSEGQTAPSTPATPVSTEQGESASPAPQAEPAKPKGRPKSAKTKLKEMNLPSARVTVICGQAGVAKLDDLTEEQAAAAVARLEKRGK